MIHSDVYPTFVPTACRLDTRELVIEIGSTCTYFERCGEEATHVDRSATPACSLHADRYGDDGDSFILIADVYDSLCAIFGDENSSYVCDSLEAA